MSENRLMRLETDLYSGSLIGMAYVRNSVDNVANVYFHIVAYINTKDNSTNVSYTIEVFKPYQPDYFKQKYTDYKEAVYKYNELTQKWDAYRPILAI